LRLAMSIVLISSITLSSRFWTALLFCCCCLRCLFARSNICWLELRAESAPILWTFVAFEPPAILLESTGWNMKLRPLDALTDSLIELLWFVGERCVISTPLRWGIVVTGEFWTQRPLSRTFSLSFWCIVLTTLRAELSPS